MRSKTKWKRQGVVHGTKVVTADPTYEIGLSAHLLATMGRAGLVELYGRYVVGTGPFDGLMRRVIWRARARRFGDGVTIAPGATFRHLERIAIGNGVHIGEQSIIQGRFDGNCRIGDKVWIGAQNFVDARDLVFEELAGTGPGVRILGSEHSGEPVERALIATHQLVGPVRIGRGALLSTGAIVLPGRRIGAGAVVAAGAVVTADVPARTVVAGVPARVIRKRT
jgi:acetyltransferase-like isoleucine patch superfamily enzyme